jgi:hypothetical protein
MLMTELREKKIAVFTLCSKLKKPRDVFSHSNRVINNYCFHLPHKNLLAFGSFVKMITIGPSHSKKRDQKMTKFFRD